ncbi:hypothetical protein N7456_003877 [Penicillium angulare]|uniref:Pyrimidine 5'-nucleotidase n=1 Tax=Penicillium angulare TaxID=116970 RepID=A0A9W9FVL2_9EURO|nr:hypothetical protein N7456_003877 [Penicillium angulare]
MSELIGWFIKADFGPAGADRNPKDNFIMKHLSLGHRDATSLQEKYYREYGLVLKGLVRNHGIDPMVYNHEVDDAIPLDLLLGQDRRLQDLLKRLDVGKVKPWLLTNAFINHADRVLKLLGVEEFFEGITYCDYGKAPIVCKPTQEMFKRAEQEAGVVIPGSCFLVDDSYQNCQSAHARGWNAIHLAEPGLAFPKDLASEYLISSIQELPIVLPQLFTILTE